MGQQGLDYSWLLPRAIAFVDDITPVQQSMARPVAGRSRRWPRILVAAAIATAAVGAVRSLQRPSEHAPEARRPPVMVATAEAQRGDIPITFTALGTVTSQYTVTVKTHLAGYLAKVSYREGQLVRAGDPLGQIDPRPYELAMAQAGGQLRKDEALLKSAQVDLERYRTLFQQDSIARQQLDEQEALVEQYRGTVELDQALLGTARLNLAYCQITAPITGQVGLRLVDPGSYLQPSDANGLVVITQLKPITVVFTLPEDSMAPVLQRLGGGATLPVTATNRSDTDILGEGVLTSVDNQIDTTTGTLKLRAQFANEAGTLFPNQFVNVRLLVDQLRGVTLIPAAAIRHGAPGDFVYVVKPDSTVVVQPIKAGVSSGEQIAVDTGLSPGDRVVVEGIDKLRDGALVAFTTGRGNRSAAEGIPRSVSGATRGNQRTSPAR